MQFNSTIFLLFLVLVMALYYQLAPRARRILLLLASYGFYWVWSIPFSGLLLLSTVIAYLSALAISRAGTKARRKLWLTLSLVLNLGILGLFKYANFFSDASYSLLGARPWPVMDLVLPLGISFYTFETVSYVIDVYRDVSKPTRSFVDVALYLSFFPHLVAGPIIRANDLMPQLSMEGDLDWALARRGVARIVWGLAKKAFVADPMAHLVNEVFFTPGAYSGPSLLLGTYAFAVQIYCDFSAYSDIAIGAAHLFGIHLPENFDKPYLACSIREFWRRWHISLSTWLRDYLYIPLGGSRRGRVMTYVNLMITMVLGGLWHGAGWTWIIWGGIQGALMSVERMIGLSEDAPKQMGWRLARWIITFHLVCFSWIWFRGGSLDAVGLILRRIVTAAPGAMELSWAPVGYIALVIVAELLDLKRRWITGLEARPVLTRWVAYASAAAFVLTFGGASNPEFIYFQF